MVLKIVLFAVYSVISAVGAGLAFLQLVSFSIYLLGILIVAMLVSVTHGTHFDMVFLTLAVQT